MHRVVARTGIGLIGIVTVAGGFWAVAYIARTPALHSLPTPPLLGALGMIMLPIACVTTWIMQRRNAQPPDPPPQPAPPPIESAPAPPQDSGPGAPDPGRSIAPAEPVRRAEPRTAERPRAHRRRVRHAPR